MVGENRCEMKDSHGLLLQKGQIFIEKCIVQKVVPNATQNYHICECVSQTISIFQHFSNIVAYFSYKKHHQVCHFSETSLHDAVVDSKASNMYPKGTTRRTVKRTEEMG